ncbi:cation acetate symporter [Streptomyces sp. NA02950]|uniref:solute symporter family protein n=1 Tax=Streptomyces sp. NA02950 TaxID=2742137 RepID=UPI00159280E3|nr:cation acetate symporter [Streptomyces sp. NA02950]QKV96205.1 cation acetate symporter [Streptomyces sp. NA02950]
MTTAQRLTDTGSFPVFVVFAIFVSGTLFLAIWVASDRITPGDFYIGDGLLAPARNGIALFGDYMSAATLLGTPGLIALTGYDGIAYLLGPVVAWIVILLLIAEPFHSTGRYTVGDVLARRLRPRPVHRAAGVTTLVISLAYLIAQLVGAGVLAAPILGLTGRGAQQAVVASLGVLMIIYVVIGGMRATTVVQLVKAVMLLAGGIVLAVLVMSKVGWNPAELLNRAADGSGLGEALLQPGVRYGDDGTGKLDSLSLQLALVLGAAGLPHLLMRLNAVPTARAARGSVQWAAYLTLAFCLMAGVLGFGAVALLGREDITADSASGNSAVLLLAEFLGGPFLLTVISCVAFTTILAVVAGTVLAASTALAHDLYQAGFKRGTASEQSELLVAKGAVVLLGLTATGLSMYAQGLNISFLVGLVFAVAGSTVLPALVYTLYWRGFTTTGALWGLYGGLFSSVLLVLLSPAMSGDAASLLPSVDLVVFPLSNPAVVSIPLGFLLGWLGSVLDRGEPGGAEFAETEARILTGAGARPDDDPV